ncbi:lysyl oxidase family protein [Plantactinospora mayteni]|uniref:lysyl oxidase family protein n=1 Tax=Plantactinospora mayteni TaxID=566021 RepID=UPI0019435EA8|nr:lysyl oxidase family protein [Plantactinospora mayteni]
MSIALTLTLFSSAPGGAAPSSASGLRLVVGAASVTLDRIQVAPGVVIPPRLDLSTFIRADGLSFQVRAVRSSYDKPVTATQVINQGGRTVQRPLPSGLVQDLSGLTNFFHITLTNAAGVIALDRDQTFCPNSAAVAARPDAVQNSSFPTACATNPFALGALWGINTGWAAPVNSSETFRPDIPNGEYTATISVNEPYRGFLDMPAEVKVVHVTVRTISQGPVTPAGPASHPAGVPSADPPHHAPSAARAPSTAKASHQRPDLRPLPPKGLAIDSRNGRDHVIFSATVWNAGPAPMIVRGYRRPGQDVMDAYQYAVDGSGRPSGFEQVGTMEWDARRGHEHWHFTDFARYSLLGADQQEIVRSQKEAFCLANTDAVDTLVDNASLDPGNRDLHSSCGNVSSLAVSQALAVGWGDTYAQTLPGQSFDVTDLPNGEYFVEIIANPNGNLVETTGSNNRVIRKIVLGGTAGARTITVPPYGSVIES